MLSYTGTALHWIDNSLMIADSLTKDDSVQEYLMEAIEKNYWSLQLTEDAITKKDRIRMGRHLRAEAARAAKRASVAAPEHPVSG